MDLLTLADPNGVVDMTHEAIARRTNRPVELIKATIQALEAPDPRSRTPDFEGARIKRLDDHRDWGWMILNYQSFREIGSEQQRRVKTLARVHKCRKKKALKECNAGVTQSNAFPYAYSSSSSSEERGSKGKGEMPPKLDELLTFTASIALSKSDAEYFFEHWLANGFTNGGKPIKNWQATIRAWKAAGHCPSQNPKANGAKPWVSAEERKQADRDEANRLYREKQSRLAREASQ